MNAHLTVMEGISPRAQRHRRCGGRRRPQHGRARGCGCRSGVAETLEEGLVAVVSSDWIQILCTRAPIAGGLHQGD